MPSALVNKDAEVKTITPGKFYNTQLDKTKLVKRTNAIKAEGASWEPTWKELATYIYPTKGFFNEVTPNQGSKIDHKTLVDEEATLDTDTFAAGMQSGFTSPARPWFRLYLDDDAVMEIEDVRFWLEDGHDTMRDVFQKSNTYPVLTSMWKELSVFSTACAYVEEDPHTVIRLYNFTAGEYYLSRDAQGRLNGFYHRFWMKTGQMVEMFGIGNCSPTVQAEYQGNSPDTWHKVNHMIETNDDRIPFMIDYSNMPYRSVYWEDGDGGNNYLRIGGYEEMPILAPRWEITTNADAYGKGGSGWKALGAVKELQKKKKNLLIALDKKTNPPLQRDASVVGDVNTLAGGITTFSAQLPNAGVKETYQVNLDIAALDASINETKQTIKKFFFADLFLMMINAEQSGQPVTAYEIAEKQSERVSKVGPLLELWQGDEFIKSLIERTFAICVRKGLFPEPPQEIAGMEIKIQYTSVLAQAQKMIEIQAIDAWAAGIMEEASINPNSLDIINFDEKNRKKAEIMGVPSSIINSLEKIAALRKQKADALANAQKQESMLAMAEAANKGAGAVKSMSQAPVGAGSALDKLTSAINEQQK